MDHRNNGESEFTTIRPSIRKQSKEKEPNRRGED